MPLYSVYQISISTGRDFSLFPLKGNCEAVRLVAQALKQLKSGVCGAEKNRHIRPGHEYLLKPLGKADGRDRKVEIGKRAKSGIQLSASAINDDEIRSLVFFR